ncbi:Succinate dehydrogenase assembly factor 2, mitochondrial [Ancistrocladus abbreviatus]
MAMLRRAGPFINRLLNMTVTTGQGISSATSNIGSTALCSRRLQLIFPAHRFYSSGESEAVSVDLSNEESKRRLLNRLLYRSKQRGFLELDLVLGKWAEEHINSMDENGIKSLIQVLDLENPDLWKWLTAQEMPPEAVSKNPVFSAVQEKVLNNLYSHSAPDTRAPPGQPWVRGWDDFSKGHYSPISGNQ